MDAPKVTRGFRDNYAAPIVYFDSAPTHSVLHGTIQIELVARILVPHTDAVGVEVMTTGRLRCSPTAAKSLHASIEKALAMLEFPQQESEATADNAN
jgi:hypothetical protein